MVNEKWHNFPIFFNQFTFIGQNIFSILRVDYKQIILNRKSMIFTKNKVAPDCDNIQYEQQIADKQISIETAPTCRICLECDQKMINPCVCTGSIGMVHQKCMISWIQAQLSRDVKYKARCQICLLKIYYLSNKQIIFNPRKWDQKLQKIHECNLVIFFLSIVLIIILAVVVHYRNQDINNGVVKLVVIIALVVISFVFIVNLMYISFMILTQTKSKIYQILDKKQIGKYTFTQHESASNLTSSDSSINYRSGSIN